MEWESKIDLTLKAIAIVVSTVVIVKGIYEYKQAQRWKKLEFLSKEMKDFFNDFNVQRALVIIDWTSTKIELLKSEIGTEDKLYFDDDLIFSALQTHKNSTTFSKEEFIIKKIFDQFFDKLSTLENYIESGLINTNDVLPYLNYYINILANPKNKRKSEKLRTQIWNYVDEYDFANVKSLCYRKEFREKNGY